MGVSAFQPPYPHLCAHRGLSRACPENTLPAFAAAMAVGAHEIEFDLWPSRDGVLAVCHDETVDRTTNGAGKIAELTWKEIRSLDAGVRLSEEWSGIRVPRLEEVLELTGRQIGLNIHIKEAGQDGSVIKRVCDLLTERELTDIAYVALGTESSLRMAREYCSEVSRACLVSQRDFDESFAIAKQYECQRIQLSRKVTAEQIERVHATGIICNMFWSDDLQEAMNYVENGVDVILTNSAHALIAGGFRPLGSTLV